MATLFYRTTAAVDEHYIWFSFKPENLKHRSWKWIRIISLYKLGTPKKWLIPVTPTDPEEEQLMILTENTTKAKLTSFHMKLGQFNEGLRMKTLKVKTSESERIWEENLDHLSVQK